MARGRRPPFSIPGGGRESPSTVLPGDACRDGACFRGFESKRSRCVNVKVSRRPAAKLDQVALGLGCRGRDEMVEDAVRRSVDALAV